MNDSAITFFGTLKHVQEGARERKEFVMNSSSATLEKAGVAVKRESDKLKISILWVLSSLIQKRSTATFAPPQTVVDYITHNYGPGWRNSNNHSSTVARGLTAAEQNAITSALTTEANKENLAILAANEL